MSTAASQRLGEIIRQIEPLGRKATGMPVSADDWNAVVGALLGVLRNEQLQEESMETLLGDRFARKEHDHAGSVTFEWLDGDLRTRIGDGAVELKSRLSTVEKKLDALTARVQRLETRNEQLQNSVDRFNISDLDRTKVLDTFRGRFEELTEVTRRMRLLGDDITATKTNINDVLEFRRTLQDVNIGTLHNDVAELKDLRRNLLGRDNQPVRILDLQLKLDELQIAAGAGEGLNQRFTDLGSVIETNVRNAANAQILQVRGELLAEQDTRITNAVRLNATELGTTLTRAAETREREVETRLSTTLGTTLLAQVRQDSDVRTRALDQKLADVDTRVTTAVTAARGDIERTVRDSLAPRFTADINTAITAAETRLTSRVQRTETAFETFRASVPDTVVANVRNETADLRDSLTQLVRSDVGTVRAEILGTIPTAVQSATTNALANLDTRINTTVTAQIGDLGGRVKREVEGATRDLPVQVETLVARQITAADIDGRVTNATAAVTTQLRNEIRETATRERNRTSTDIDVAKLQMRGEISASTEVAKNSAVAEARVLVETQRADTDAKFRVVGTRANIPELTRQTVVINPGVLNPGIIGRIQ